MNKILIGSKAIKYWFPDFPREGKDTDYAVETNIGGSTREVEYLVNPILFKYKGEIYHGVEYDWIASTNMLYTLKMSHMFWNINWSKHIYDIQWMKNKGCKVILPLFNELYAYWNDYHSKNKRSDLKMTADDFFNNALKSEHSHDYLHTLLVNPPTYTKILIGEVEVCEEKFNALPYSDKLSLVREEVMIMAWERAPKWDYRFAYEAMLKKFIIGHAPIWEAIFILDNFKDLYRPEFNYFKVLEDGVKSRDNKQVSI